MSAVSWRSARRAAPLLIAPLLGSLVTLPGPAVAQQDMTALPTSVTALSGTPVQGGMSVSGTAVFGGQKAVEVADDAPYDAGLTPNVGDREGFDRYNGVDLIGATLSVPNPDAPELLVQWQVSVLPPTGALPEGTRYTFPFKVGSSVYQVQAKFSNLADPDDPQGAAARVGAAFELRGNCTPGFMGTGMARCSHLSWITGGFDTLNSIVSARVPLGSQAAPQIAPGAILVRNDSTNPDLNDVVAGYPVGSVSAATIGDHAEYGDGPGYAFEIPGKVVRLGIAAEGTEPSDVDFSSPATLAADGAFTGTVSTAGFDPGSFDVYAKACFADNCGVRSLGGIVRADADLVGTLRLTANEADSEVFWMGGKVGNEVFYSLPLGSPASCSNSPCFRYKLKVASPSAERLRIAIDAPRRADGYLFQVTEPGGTVRPAQSSGGGRFNAEDFIAGPETGIYSILVRPHSVTTSGTSFSMRAKLEAHIPTFPPDENGRLLPDMQPSAPYDLGFAAPVNPANGPFLAPDAANPPGDVGGVHPVSCSPDETFGDNTLHDVMNGEPVDEDGPHTRCLRLSFGLSNVGPGKFDVFSSVGFTTVGPQPATQCIERPDQTPSFETRPAGEFEFHQTHGHRHYKDIVQLELFRVTDPTTGTMVPTGVGRKIGYSPANQGYGDWYSFDQPDGASSQVPDCSTGNRLGLAPGWGDVYRWQRVGNYVNFGDNPDGQYVLRLTVDPKGNLLESNKANNASYTYFRVTGTDLRVGLERFEVLEQGRGQSPWDPDKVIVKPRYRGGVPW